MRKLSILIFAFSTITGVIADEKKSVLNVIDQFDQLRFTGHADFVLLLSKKYIESKYAAKSPLNPDYPDMLIYQDYKTMNQGDSAVQPTNGKLLNTKIHSVNKLSNGDVLIFRTIKFQFRLTKKLYKTTYNEVFMLTKEKGTYKILNFHTDQVIENAQ